MREMLEWIAEAEPVYHTISDYCPHGVWRCPDNPASADVFRAAISGNGNEEEPERGCVRIPFFGCI
jgi:hypothetical protein